MRKENICPSSLQFPIIGFIVFSEPQQALRYPESGLLCRQTFLIRWHNPETEQTVIHHNWIPPDAEMIVQLFQLVAKIIITHQWNSIGLPPPYLVSSEWLFIIMVRNNLCFRQPAAGAIFLAFLAFTRGGGGGGGLKTINFWVCGGAKILVLSWILQFPARHLAVSLL